MSLWMCAHLELLVLGVVVVSALLQLSDLTVQPGHHRLPVIPQLPVPLLLHLQALPQRQDVHTLQIQLVFLHTHTHRHKDKLSTTWRAVKKNVHINRYFKAVFSSLFLSLKWFRWSCSEGRRGHRCFFFTNRIFLTAQMCQCSTPVYISFLETNHPSWCLCNHHLLKSDRLSRMQTNRLQLHFFFLLRAADDTRLI